MAVSCVTGRSIGFGDPIASHGHRNPHAFEGLMSDLTLGMSAFAETVSPARGPATATAGTATFHKGALLSTTGKGAVVGIPMMIIGSISAGLGVTRSADDFLGDGQTDIPSGAFELGAMMSGNDALRPYGAGADLLTSSFAPPLWAGLLDVGSQTLEYLRDIHKDSIECEE